MCVYRRRCRPTTRARRWNARTAGPSEASWRIETRARAEGIKRLFVLTTVTAHWFRERGFVEQTLAELPEEKRLVYNLQRRSKIFAKNL